MQQVRGRVYAGAHRGLARAFSQTGRKRLRNGTLRPRDVLTQTEPMMDVLEAFDRRDAGWIKVALNLSG